MGRFAARVGAQRSSDVGAAQGVSARETSRDMVNTATPQIMLAGASWSVPGLLRRRAAKLFFQKFPRDEKQLHGNGTANGTTTAIKPDNVSLNGISRR